MYGPVRMRLGSDESRKTFFFTGTAARLRAAIETLLEF